MILFAKLQFPAEVIADKTVLKVDYIITEGLIARNPNNGADKAFLVRGNYPFQILSCAVVADCGLLAYDLTRCTINIDSVGGTQKTYRFYVPFVPCEEAIGETIRLNENWALINFELKGTLSMVNLPDSLNGETIKINAVVKIDIDERAILWQ